MCMSPVIAPRNTMGRNTIGNFWNPKTLILLVLGIVALFLLGLKLRGASAGPIVTSSQLGSLIAAPSPTVPPATGTFVDGLYGTVLYQKDGKLQELTLPSRVEKTIADAGLGQIPSLPVHEVTWSVDGQYIAVLKTESQVVVTNYETGSFVASYTLPFAFDESQMLRMVFSPDSKTLVLYQSNAKQSLLVFVDILTGKETGRYTNCSTKGYWVNDGYITVCSVAGEESLALISFDGLTPSMITLVPNLHQKKLELLSEYSETEVLLVKTDSPSLIYRVGKTATMRQLTVSEMSKIPDVSKLRDPYAALRQRIMSTLKVETIDDVSVANNSKWMIYHTKDGLWIEDIALKEKPFHLGEGQFPRIRPF